MKTCNLKIMMVSSTFHPVIGGKERQALQLAKKLTERGAKLSVLTRFIPGQPEIEEYEGITIYRKIKTIEFFPVWAYSYVRSAYNFLKKHRELYDVIHCHQIYLCAIGAIRAGRKFGVPVIAKKISTDFYNDITMLKKVRFGSFFVPEVANISGVVSICEKVREETLKDGMPASKIFKIYNGVDTEYFRPAKEKITPVKNFIFVGRLHDAVKDIRGIMTGFVEVKKTHPDLTLTILGEGPDKESLKQFAAQLPCSGSITFDSTKDPLKYYQESDALILASRTEGLPNVSLEAMSCGVPTIGTTVGGIPEILHPEMNGNAPELKDGEIFTGSNGILIPVNSVASITKAMKKMVEDFNLYENYTKTVRQFMIDNFAFDIITDKYIDLYTSLIEKIGRECGK